MEKIAQLNPVLLDVIIGAIMLIFALIKAKIGILKGILSVAAFLLAVGIAFVGSKYLLPIVKPYVWDKIEIKIEEKVNKELDGLSDGTSGFSDTVKDSWNTFIDNFGSDKLEFLKSEEVTDGVLKNTDLKNSELMQSLKTLAIEKGEIAAEKVIRIILAIVIYFVAHLLLKLLVKWLNKAGDLPIIGWVNHTLGFVVGLIEITVLFLIVVRGANLFNISFFTDLAEGTYILKWLCGGSVFELIALKDQAADIIGNITQSIVN